MNALSKLLVKVSKRVLTRNPTNDELLQVADRVVLWSNANYITEQQVDEIAAAVPEEPVSVDETETEETSTVADNEPESVDDSELSTDTESEE